LILKAGGDWMFRGSHNPSIGYSGAVLEGSYWTRRDHYRQFLLLLNEDNAYLFQVIYDGFELWGWDLGFRLSSR